MSDNQAALDNVPQLIWSGTQTVSLCSCWTAGERVTMCDKVIWSGAQKDDCVPLRRSSRQRTIPSAKNTSDCAHLAQVQTFYKVSAHQHLFRLVLTMQFGAFTIQKAEIFAQTARSFAFVNLKPIVPGAPHWSPAMPHLPQAMHFAHECACMLNGTRMRCS